MRKRVRNVRCVTQNEELDKEELGKEALRALVEKRLPVLAGQRSQVRQRTRVTV